MAEQQKASDGIRDGLKAGIGILAALKDAFEETIDEMRERGDISPERAKEAVRSTMQRAQEAMGDARDGIVPPDHRRIYWARTAGSSSR